MKKNYSLLFVVYFFGIIICPLIAQQLRFEQLGIAQGLPSSEVYGLHLDKNGYIWAFTDYGIVKHNGNRFIPSCTNIPYRRSVVYFSQEDAQGNLLLANSRAEILRVSNDSAFGMPGMEDVSKNLLKSGYGICNLLIKDSVAFISNSSLSFKTAMYPQGAFSDLSTGVPADTLVYQLVSSGKYINRNAIKTGNLSLFKNNEVPVLFKDGKNTLRYTLAVKTLRPTRQYIEQHGDLIYIMFSHQIFIIHKPSGSIKSLCFEKQVLKYQVDAQGCLWVCLNKGGLEVYNAKHLLIGSYLKGVSITDIVHDRVNGIWLSSLEGGVYHCKTIFEKNYENDPLIGRENISCIKQIKGELFIGTVSGNMLVMGKTVRNYSVKSNQFENNDIQDIILFKDSYFIGTKNGAYRLDAGQKKPVRISAGIRACNLFVNFKDSLWYVSNHSVITGLVKQTYAPLVDIMITTGKYDSDKLLLGTDNGLYDFDFSTLRISNPRLKESYIRKLYTDPQKQTWVCTKGDGLYKLSYKGIPVPLKNIPSQFINDIKVFRDSFVVISTNTGLYVNSLKKMETLPWNHFLENETGCVEFFDGKLFTGTKKGLVSLEETILTSPFLGGFYLADVKVNGSKLTGPLQDLIYYQKNIVFTFDVLDFMSEVKTLHYVLDGPVKSSGLKNGTELSFQNLSPGAYTLLVWPAETQQRDPKKITLTFTIQPAFWQTKNFYLLIGLCFILMVSGVFVLILKTRERKRKKQFEVEQQFAEQKLTALKAQINPHFISNSLAAIQQLIISDEIDKAGLYIAMFSRFIREVLHSSSKLLVPLSEELEVIDLYIELEKLRFVNKFSFYKNIENGIDEEEILVPPLITQPLIENAIWHGLLPLNNLRDPILLLNIFKKGNKVIIEIKDNGVGRKVQDLQKESSKDSRGMDLVKSRIDNLNKIDPELNATFEIEDIKNEQGTAMGTKIIISTTQTP